MIIVHQGDTVPIKQSCRTPPSQLLATTNSLSALVDWHLRTFYTNGSIYQVAFCIWLPSLNVAFLRFIRAVACARERSYLCRVTSHCVGPVVVVAGHLHAALTWASYFSRVRLVPPVLQA